MQAQEVVSTAGNTFTNSNGSMSFTIGEGVTNTLTTGEQTITQGFQQPHLSVSMINQMRDLGFTITVFPNPVTDVLTLKIGKDDVLGMQYMFFDLAGKPFNRKNLVNPETTIPVEHFRAGVYIIKILEGSKELKSFKIIKY